MSWASVYTNFLGNPQITSSIGNATELASTAGNGGNLPTPPTALVDGTTYNIITKPFPFGYGLYSVSVNFDFAGDNTSIVESIYLELFVGGALEYNDTPYVNVDLINTDLISYSKVFIINYTPAYVNGTLNVTFKSLFSGTALTISSAYCDISKLN